ncbi:MAG: ATP-binding cassette domain-containing protein [Proteobacteria bacterium]|nr:MAG: ATP-binding cassette domain-containing protein [Pseudomonadota bacterium]
MYLLNFFRHLMFSQVKPLVILARKKVLQAEDMPPLPAKLNPRRLPFDDSLLDSASARTLLISLLRAGKPMLLPALGLNLGYVALNLTKPVLVNSFIKQISGDLHRPDGLTLALLLALGLGLVSFVGSLGLQHYFFYVLNINQLFTNALNRRLYRRSLGLTQKARAEIQVGDVVNHMSSDTDSLAEFSATLGDAIISFVTIVGSCALLFYYLGATAFLAVALLFLMVPLSRSVARSFSALDEELMRERDKRVTLMSQVMSGIRVVKYFAWEKSVRQEVGEVREKELRARKKLARAEAYATLSYVAISTLVLFAALTLHVFRGITLTPELVFTVVAIFSLLEDPLSHLSEVISRAATGFVAAGRIASFLNREALPYALVNETPDETLCGLNLDNLSVQFPGSTSPTLDGLTLRILPGESVAVVGPVGSGKSTFVQALLRELPLHRGALTFTDLRGKSVVPKIAYVPQEAFIINGTMEENIYFGAKANPKALQEALFASCLDADLPLLPAGLFTEIGEKGVNLSGGQKQRVSLARAVMHRPTFALLDDPLSAVDARTEGELIERLIDGAWRGITRVVVTHRLAYLARFDKVIFLVNGKLEGVGTLDELCLKLPSFRAFFADSARAEHGTNLLAAGPEKTAPATAPGAASPAAAAAPAEARLTEDEDRAIGAVKSHVYFDYIKVLGGTTFGKRLVMVPLLLLSSIAASSLPLIQKSWLAFSSNLQAGKEAPSGAFLDKLALNPHWAVGVYGLIGIAILIGVLINRLLWLERGIAAGKRMHNDMLRSVLKAPLRFFDATPVGRILQRFSRDVEAVDIHLQWSFEITVRCLVNIATALFLIVSVLPIMLLVMGPVFWLYYVVQRDYRVPAREVKRLDAISRSPRFAHFKETLQGLVVIRSFGRMETFFEGFLSRLEHSQRMFHAHYMLNRWFSSRIPLLGGIVASGTAVGIVFYAYYGKISPGVAGLVMIYALSLWESLNWAVRIFAEVEARMTSVERLRYYGNLEAEQDTLHAPLPAATAWPSQGEVVFDTVVARYAPHLPPVLKGISFRIPAGARVGVIGRTGSGKSTLLQSLYRGMELESGAIRIDGVDIASVPLERLRRSLAIIPQDPTLFLGTLRSNLDRYGEYSDAEILEALEQARLGDFVRGIAAGLLAPVQENGANLSQGQRQLLCLARALLSDAKVIVMDEATASVDVQTDNLLQEVVRTSCQGVTMIIIAHRLGTVADCDLIFEVREGKLHRTLDLKKEEASAPVV